MKKKLFLAILAAIVTIWLARQWYWESLLNREEASVNQMLLSQPSRFQNVHIAREKEHYNILLGRVASPEDIDFLTNELARLGVQRCIFGVRADDALNPTNRMR